MNERIRELAVEAGLLVYNPGGVPTKLELFAELLVKECASVGSNVVLAQTEDNDMGVFLGIKNHFGVEL